MLTMNITRASGHRWSSSCCVAQLQAAPRLPQSLRRSQGRQPRRCACCAGGEPASQESCASSPPTWHVHDGQGQSQMTLYTDTLAKERVRCHNIQQSGDKSPAQTATVPVHLCVLYFLCHMICHFGASHVRILVFACILLRAFHRTTDLLSKM